MTKEELEKKAEETLNKRLGTYGYVNKSNCQKPYIDGYIDGAQENGVVWHDLRKNPKDLPDTSREVLCCLEHGLRAGRTKYYIQGCYHNNWRLSFFGSCIEGLDEVIAWCEIPTKE